MRIPLFAWPASQLRRARRLTIAVSARYRSSGGIGACARKAQAVFRREGWLGLKLRLRQISEPSAFIIDENSKLINRHDYTEWVRRYDTLTAEDRVSIRQRIATM